MKRLPALFLTASLAFPAQLFAAMEEVPFTARSMAMADALTADAEDLSGLILNPATLGHLQRSEMTFGIRRLFDIPAGKTDINGMNIGAATPLGKWNVPGTMGFSWTHDRFYPTSLDRVFALSYGSKSWREFGPGVFDVGLSLKMLKRGGQNFGGNFSKGAVDVGTYYRWGERQAVGFSILNLNRPQVGLSGYNDRAPVAVKLGYVQRVRRFTVATDLTRRGASGSFGETTSASMGVEHGWGTAKYGSFTARSGLILSTKARSWSLGGGWNILGTHVDYALRVPLSGGSRWSHMISLTYRFGQWDPEVEYERLLTDEIRYREDLTRALESAEIKQWKLAEELRFMREEIEDMKLELAVQAAKTGQAQDKLEKANQVIRLKKLEEQRRQAAIKFKEMEKERERLRLLNKKRLLEEEWNSYNAVKLEGVSNLVLIDRLKRMLRQFKGQNVDLGKVHQELNRLMQERQ